MSFKTAREAAKLTQDEIATKLNISRSTVSMWETGASFPRASTLLRLAALLHCTVDELLGADNELTEADKSA